MSVGNTTGIGGHFGFLAFLPPSFRGAVCPHVPLDGGSTRDIAYAGMFTWVISRALLHERYLAQPDTLALTGAAGLTYLVTSWSLKTHRSGLLAPGGALCTLVSCI